LPAVDSKHMADMRVCCIAGMQACFPVQHCVMCTGKKVYVTEEELGHVCMYINTYICMYVYAYICHYVASRNRSCTLATQIHALYMRVHVYVCTKDLRHSSHKSADKWSTWVHTGVWTYTYTYTYTGLSHKERKAF
jgi:hypothetical protein